jgi:pimeloyl-ACP methyl ester carboxylesterase
MGFPINLKTTKMKQINSRSIVFITGAFVGHSCWNEWKAHFEGNGYSCIAPPWPHKDAAPAVLRSRQPDAGIASDRLTQILDHYANIIRQLPEKPIAIGHSLGGLLTQLLLQRDLLAAGVAIHSVPPQGVIPTQFSFYRATWKSLGLFTSTKKSYLMSFKDWQYAFTNGMSLEQQKQGYEQFAIPESKLALRDGLTSAAKLDFRKPHAPLLFTSGSTDHCVPAALNKTNFNKYQHADSVTELKTFTGRNHFVLGQPTWREDADYILDWLGSH